MHLKLGGKKKNIMKISFHFYKHIIMFLSPYQRALLVKDNHLLRNKSFLSIYPLIKYLINYNAIKMKLN